MSNSCVLNIFHFLEKQITEKFFSLNSDIHSLCVTGKMVTFVLPLSEHINKLTYNLS